MAERGKRASHTDDAADPAGNIGMLDQRQRHIGHRPYRANGNLFTSGNSGASRAHYKLNRILLRRLDIACLDQPIVK
ncbi:hypothetical protein D3C80_1436350 [compost metagenome]